MYHRTRRRIARSLLGILLVSTGTMILGGHFDVTPAEGSVAHAAPSGLHVLGNRLVDASNQPVMLRGANRSGTEYSCLGGPNFADGPTDAASVQAMAAWGLNTVRVPLNEDCWLGINGVAVGGAAYQQDIKSWVDTLTQNGMYVILDLHWSAPGAARAVGQQPMPDQDHSPAFWSGVAGTFASYPNVIFDLFNEPFPDSHAMGATAWQCVRDGGSCAGVPYTAAGMQELVNTVRGAGATNLILVGGANYSTALSDPALGSGVSLWLNYLPSDPLHNLAASWHSYDFSGCNDPNCWQETAALVATRYPIVVGEFGDTNCTSQYTAKLLPWLDSAGISYVGWDWGTDFQCQSLITDYNGTPSQPYGQAYKDHLASLGSASAPPTATAVPPTATAVPPTATAIPSTATAVPSATPPTLATATGTPVPPTTSPSPEPIGQSSSIISLDLFFNNVGISSDNNPTLGNFDSQGYSYSAQALQAAGLAPGEQFRAAGASLQWPAAQSGTPDNVLARGQRITLSTPQGGSNLVFVGSASGASQWAGTITYSDGSTQSYQLGYSDWTLDGGRSQPDYGDLVVATMPYRNDHSSGRVIERTDVFAAAVPLQAGKLVTALTLPMSMNQGGFHLFAVSLAGTGAPSAAPTAISTLIPPTATASSTSVPAAPVPATATPKVVSVSQSVRIDLDPLLNNRGISNDSNPGVANFDSQGFSYSAQTLRAAGLVSGQISTLAGVPFPWTAASPGSADNVIPGGQTINLPTPIRSNTLTFLGAASGASRLTGTVGYTDGSTQTYQIGFSDWTLDGGRSQPAFGNQIAVTLPYRNHGYGGRSNERTYLFTTAVTLQPGKTLAWLRLPNSDTSGGFHIFAASTT